MNIRKQQIHGVEVLLRKTEKKHFKIKLHHQGFFLVNFSWDYFKIWYPNSTAMTGSNHVCCKQIRLMCTYWVSEGAREYSLWNHTGPPALWSLIRLVHWPNYSQSQPIKANYGQLCIIRMPWRLIAQRDGAWGCHFWKNCHWPFTPSQSKSLCWVISEEACRLKKDF